MTVVLEQQVREVAIRRAQVAQLAESLKAKKIAFAASIAEESAVYEVARAALDASDAATRALAIAQYDSTPEEDRTKQPIPGVGIQVATEYLYDVKDALAWAKAKQMCLVPESLNVAAFEGLMKAQPEAFDFVVTQPVTKAVLAKDLSGYLDQPAPAHVPRDIAPLTAEALAQTPF